MVSADRRKPMTTMSLLLLFVVMSFCFIGTSNGMPSQTNECPTKTVMCTCGRNPVVHQWQVPLCQGTKEQYCAQFQDCEECYPDGGHSCKSCPPEKFGQFCENRCICENGGICDNSGRCSCPEGFDGPLCDKRKDTDEPSCGIAPMTGYQEGAKIGRWPWQAALLRCDEYESDGKCEYQCGGSLLNDLWVIMAAECLTYLNATHGIFPKESMRIALGKYYSDISKDDDYVQVREIDEYYIHPNFRMETLDADIAVVKLHKAVEMSMRVQPVCLPSLRTSESNIVDGNYGIVTGWTMNEDYNITDTLEEAAVPVLPERYCNSGSLPFNVTENLFCTAISEPYTPELYYVDIGDPIYFRDSLSKEKPWVIEGITVFDDSANIENGDFIDMAVYTRLSNYLDWIKFCIENY